jgi:hypothetical protein
VPRHVDHRSEPQVTGGGADAYLQLSAGEDPSGSGMYVL